MMAGDEMRAVLSGIGSMGNEFKQRSGDMQEQLRLCEQLVADASWTGSAADRFRQDWEMNKKQMEDIKQACDELGAALSSIGQNYNVAEDGRMRKVEQAMSWNKEGGPIGFPVDDSGSPFKPGPAPGTNPYESVGPTPIPEDPTATWEDLITMGVATTAVLGTMAAAMAGAAALAGGGAAAGGAATTGGAATAGAGGTAAAGGTVAAGGATAGGAAAAGGVAAEAALSEAAGYNMLPTVLRMVKPEQLGQAMNSAGLTFPISTGGQVQALVTTAWPAVPHAVQQRLVVSFAQRYAPHAVETALNLARQGKPLAEILKAMVP
jgi:uncharacterized protein YukE